MATSTSALLLMDHLQSLCEDSLVTSLFIGSALSTLIPLVIVPLTRYLTRNKRSINHHLDMNKKPDDYNFVVTRTVLMTGLATGAFLHIAASYSNVLWSLADATPTRLLKTFLGCFFLREFLSYWSHRIFHCKFLYRFHEDHHRILYVHGDYDGYYIDMFETATAAAIAFVPTFVIPQVHVIAVILYVVVVAFFVFSLNHCGREFRIAFEIPGMEMPLVLFDTRGHDDHHVYRHGNYAELVPLLDDIFGTRIVVRKRRTLPAKRMWRKAQKILILLRVVNALKEGAMQATVREETKDFPSLRHSSNSICQKLER